MTYVLIHHTVRDVSIWRPVFDEHEAARQAAGALGMQLFCDPGTPNDLFVLLEWDNIERARAFLASDDLRETMQRAGVEGEPELHFLATIDHAPVDQLPSPRSTADLPTAGGQPLTTEATGAPLSLSPTETEVLRSVLTHTLANLHDEIYKTENHDFHAQLTQREALLSGMPTRLPA